MIQKPGNNKRLFKIAESLFFFVVALIVLLISAIFEWAQSLAPMQVSGDMLLFLLMLGLVGLVIILRALRH